MNSLRVAAVGLVFDIDFDTSVDADAVRTVRAAFSPLVGGAAADVRVSASMDMESDPPSDRPFARGADADGLVASLVRTIEGLVVGSMIPDTSQGRVDELPARIALQASSVAIGDEAVVIFGGGARRDALRELGEGAGLIGTDLTVVDRAEGLVTGIPLGEHEGMEVVEEPRVLRSFVFLVHDPAGDSGWEPISVPQSVVLASSSLPVFSVLRSPLTSSIELFALTSAAVVVRYRDAAEIPALLKEALEEPQERSWAQPTDTRATESESLPVIGDVRRVAMRDVVTDGTYIAFCTAQNEVSVAGGIAPYIWDIAEEWTGVDEIARRLVEQLGAPDGDARPQVAAAIDALVTQGVLVRI